MGIHAYTHNMAMANVVVQQCCKIYFFALFKYKIQNTFGKMYLKYFYRILLKLV